MGRELLSGGPVYGVQCQDASGVNRTHQRTAQENHRKNEQQWVQGIAQMVPANKKK